MASAAQLGVVFVCFALISHAIYADLFDLQAQCAATVGPTVPHCTSHCQCSSSSHCPALHLPAWQRGMFVTLRRQLREATRLLNWPRMWRGERGAWAESGAGGGGSSSRSRRQSCRSIWSICVDCLSQWPLDEAIQWLLGEGRSDILLGVSRCSQVLNIRVCVPECVCVCVENLR